MELGSAATDVGALPDRVPSICSLAPGRQPRASRANPSNVSVASTIRSAALTACLALLSLAVGAAPANAARLDTALLVFGYEPDEEPAFTLVRRAGANHVKLWLGWGVVAPTRPAAPEDPNDPAYDWTWFDRKLEAARAQGLEPIVMVAWAPAWAVGGNSWRDGWRSPDATDFAAFARAAATRYSGRFYADPSFPYAEALPRVRYWQAWNEPNLDAFFWPQHEHGRLVSPTRYRELVNRFSDAVKAVDPANLVLAGGTGPHGWMSNSAPLVFMRQFLCLTPDLSRRPGCAPVRFDIWGHHPYTYGGPTRSARSRNDVSIGDLPDMARVLRAGVARRTIRSDGRVRFWVDEFSWDTNGPDPGGMPPALHARWVSEALYRMAKAGVSLVAWQQLLDTRWTGPCGDPFQGGLYFHSESVASARPKPLSLTAFAFPFVAFPKNGRILVWGRTPNSHGGHVVVERKLASGWRRVGALRTSAAGTFSARYALPLRRGSLRARFAGRVSVPFSLVGVRDRFVQPFGTRAPPGGCP